MKTKLKPLFSEGEETEGSLARMVPEPAVLGRHHVAEAKRLCEREVQVCIERRHAFRTFEMVYAVRRRFIMVGQPWLWRVLSADAISRLACQRAEAVGWLVRTVDIGDRAATLYCPSERACRAWWRKHLPYAWEVRRHRHIKGKPGRTPKRIGLAKFAIARLRRRLRMTGREIANEWNYDHPYDRVTAETVRNAAKRWRPRIRERRAK